MPYDTTRHPLTRFTPVTSPLTDAERRSLARHGPVRGKAPIVAAPMSLVPLRGIEPETGDDAATRPRSLIPLAGTARAPKPDAADPADAPLARPVPGISTAFGVPFGASEPAFPADAPLVRPDPRVPTAFGVPLTAALEPPVDPAPGREATARLMNIADARQAQAPTRPTLAASEDDADHDVFAGIGGSERDLAIWNSIRDDVDSGRLTPEMIARRIGNLRRAPVGHTLADQQLLAALEIMQDRDLARREAQGLGLDPERLDRLSRMRAEGGSADDVADEIRGLVLDLLPFIGGAKATAETVAAAEDFRRAMEAGDRDAMLEAGLLTLIGAAAWLPGGGVIARIGRGAVKSALRGAGRTARKAAETVIPTHMARIDLATYLRQYHHKFRGPELEEFMDPNDWKKFDMPTQNSMKAKFRNGWGRSNDLHARERSKTAGFSSNFVGEETRNIIFDPMTPGQPPIYQVTDIKDGRKFNPDEITNEEIQRLFWN